MQGPKEPKEKRERRVYGYGQGRRHGPGAVDAVDREATQNSADGAARCAPQVPLDALPPCGEL